MLTARGVGGVPTFVIVVEAGFFLRNLCRLRGKPGCGNLPTLLQNCPLPFCPGTQAKCLGLFQIIF